MNVKNNVGEAGIKGITASSGCFLLERVIGLIWIPRRESQWLGFVVEGLPLTTLLKILRDVLQ